MVQTPTLFFLYISTLMPTRGPEELIGMRSGTVIWLKGLENYQWGNCETEIPTADITNFIVSKKTDNVFHTQVYSEMIEGLHKFNHFTEIREGIIDVEIDSQQVRFVLKKLSRNEFEDFVINVSDKKIIVIANRPYNLSKREAENKISENDRLSIDLPMPKTNVLGLIKNNIWTKECVTRTLAKALVKFIYDVVVAITASTILRTFQ